MDRNFDHRFKQLYKADKKYIGKYNTPKKN